MNGRFIGSLSAGNVVDGSINCTMCRHILDQDPTPVATALSVDTRAAKEHWRKSKMNGSAPVAALYLTFNRMKLQPPALEPMTTSNIETSRCGEIGKTNHSKVKEPGRNIS